MGKWIGSIIGAIIAGIVVYYITNNLNLINTNSISKLKDTIVQNTDRKGGALHVSASTSRLSGYRRDPSRQANLAISVFSDNDGSPIAEANVKIDAECGQFTDSGSNIGWGKNRYERQT